MVANARSPNFTKELRGLCKTIQEKNPGKSDKAYAALLVLALAAKRHKVA